MKGSIFALGMTLMLALFLRPTDSTDPDPSDCLEELDYGTPGPNPRTMFYYNQIQSICKPFPYKGLGGNNNKFTSPDICEGLCVIPM